MALGVDALQLFQGGLASPQTLRQTGVVTKPLQVGDTGSPTQACQPPRVKVARPAVRVQPHLVSLQLGRQLQGRAPCFLHRI